MQRACYWDRGGVGVDEGKGRGLSNKEEEELGRGEEPGRVITA